MEKKGRVCLEIRQRLRLQRRPLTEPLVELRREEPFSPALGLNSPSVYQE